MTITATDLFAGAGGASEGLSQAGISIAHQLNHPGTEHRQANVQDVDWRSFPSSDILWASPSCVHHAPSGGRKRATLGAEMLRNTTGAIDRATAFAVIAAAEVHQYPVILVENVPEFASWALYDWWLDGLAQLGYETTQLRLDAADYGHAQHRRRSGVDIDLTPPELDPVYAADILENDPGKQVTRQLYVADQINAITEANTRHLVTYRRNARAQNAGTHRLPTVTAGGNHHGLAWVDDAGRQFHRMLTNRECARAQGFGDDYQFLGTKKQQKFLIGNAVPVGIARWLGHRAVAALT